MAEDTTGKHGRHEAPEPAGATAAPGATGAADEEVVGFWAELRDAVSTRTLLIILGVLLLQLGFILSYVGAFHRPTPRDVPIAVVAPAPVADRTAAQLNAIPGQPVAATVVADEKTGRDLVEADTSAALLVVDPTGTTDRLLVSSAAGTSVTTAVETVIQQADAASGRSVQVTDVVPLQGGDGRGLTGFYLVVGWVVGGYLVAALLGVAKGSRPANRRRALFRLGAVVPYAILSGLGGALIVGPLLGALTGHLPALWALGTLVVLAAAAVTMALQVLFGVIGIGLTVLLFVVLGNPSAGGAYQARVLPWFWRTLGPGLPNGAATDAVRRIVYFHAHAITGAVLVVAAYAVVGALVAVVAAPPTRRRRPAVGTSAV